MMTSRRFLWSVVAVVLVGTVVAVVYPYPGDVRFCKRTVTGLTRGDLTVHRAIAWEQFKAFEMDVAKSYGGLLTPQERAGYEQAFIVKFAQGFRESGGSLQDFVNWRRQQSGIVAADHRTLQRTLLMQVSGGRQKQLVSIQWKP